jgi:hypothetical protein
MTPDSIEPFTRSGCAMSNILLEKPLMYWEVEMNSTKVKIIESNNYVCATGICFQRDVDKVPSILDNYSAYIVGLGKNAKHRLDIFCSKEGKIIGSTELPRITGRNVCVHIGMLLDLRNRTFYIVNVESNELICHFFIIKAPQEDNQYVAVFEVHEDADSIEIISGKRLKKLPSVLSTLL